MRMAKIAKSRIFFNEIFEEDLQFLNEKWLFGGKILCSLIMNIDRVVMCSWDILQFIHIFNSYFQQIIQLSWTEKYQSMQQIMAT